MIPTAATNAASTQSATIGIAALILEGRALSEDEFILTNNCKKHILLMPPGYVNRSSINITTNPTSDLTLASLNHRSTSNSGNNIISNNVVTSTVTSNNSASITTSSDTSLQHYQRLRQKLTQLRQSSPSTSREPYPSGEQKIVVGTGGGGSITANTGNDSSTTNSPDNTIDAETIDEIDTEVIVNMPRFGIQRRSSTAGLGGGNSSSVGGSSGGGNGSSNNIISGGGGGGNIIAASDLGRYIFSAQNQTNQPSSTDNNLLFTLQSLATTCLYSTPRAFAIPREYMDQQQQSTSITTNSNNNNSNIHNYSNRNKNSSNSNNSNNSNNYQNNKITDSGYENKKNVTVFPKQGPHCDQFLNKLGMMGKEKQFEFEEHNCDMANLNEICYQWQIHCRQIEVMLSRSDPICVEVYLGPENQEILLEQWVIEELDTPMTPNMTLQALCNAIRSQLYFSQITAWTDLIKKMQPYDKEILENGRIKTSLNSSASNMLNKKPRLDIYYRIKPYDTTASSSFHAKPNIHNFPNVLISENCAISVCLKSLPRLHNGIPKIEESITHETSPAIGNLLIPPPVYTILNNQQLLPGQQKNNECCTSTSSNSINTTNYCSSENLLIRTITDNPDDSNQLLNAECCDDESMLLVDNDENCIDLVICDEKVKFKCAYNDEEDDEEEEEEEDGCSSDNFGECSSSGNNGSQSTDNNSGLNVSHREKQLLKYRKRMLKRDKKKKLPDNQFDMNSITAITAEQKIHNNCRRLLNINNSCIIGNNCQSMKMENFNGGCTNIEKNINLTDSVHHQQPEFGSINSMRPPLYQTTSRNIAESVQTQCVEMISIGTQTLPNSPNNNNNNNTSESTNLPNCDQCNNEMSFVCLNCNDVTSTAKAHYAYHCNKETGDPTSPLLSVSKEQSEMNKATVKTLDKGELLLQAIQRVPRSKSNQQQTRNYNNNNNNNISKYRNLDLERSGFDECNDFERKQTSITTDCQLCKRQKTQHNFKKKENRNYGLNNNNNNNNNYYNYNNNSSSCCNLQSECSAQQNEKFEFKKFQRIDDRKCNCSLTCLTVRMDDDNDEATITTAITNTTNNTKITTIAANNHNNNTESSCSSIHNSNNNLILQYNLVNNKTPTKQHQELSPTATIETVSLPPSASLSLYKDVTAQFKTPKSGGYLSPKHLQNNNQHQLLIKPNNNLNNCSSEKNILKKKALPKINLSNVFCNQSSVTSSTLLSSPISINSNGGINNNSLKSMKAEAFLYQLNQGCFNNNRNGESTNHIITTPPEIPVQKSNSAPALPNSPSLSPRFIKQAAIYKRRSRHLSDRSDRSSFGSDEQLSDEDLDSFGFSPSGSPIKNKFFSRMTSAFGRRPLLGNLEESLFQKRIVPKTQVAGFKVLLGASGGFCPNHLTIPAAAYFYELNGEALSTPYMCEIRLPRKGYTIPRSGTVQATLLNPIGTVVRMFVIPYDLRDMPPMNQTFIRQRIVAVDSDTSIDGGSVLNSNTVVVNNNNINNTFISSNVQQQCPKKQMQSLRYSIHLRFQTSRSGRLTLHTDIRFLISRRTDCDTAAAHTKGALESPNELRILTQQPENPRYSSRIETNPNKI